MSRVGAMSNAQRLLWEFVASCLCRGRIFMYEMLLPLVDVVPPVFAG
jgi:hypothetical protein